MTEDHEIIIGAKEALYLLKMKDVSMMVDIVFKNIRQWATARNLDDSSRVHAQMTKLMEEAGELARGIGKGDMPLIKDSIGDCVVVLTILALQYGITIEECIASAYNEIKDRQGKTVNGMFVKEAKPDAKSD